MVKETVSKTAIAGSNPAWGTNFINKGMRYVLVLLLLLFSTASYAPDARDVQGTVYFYTEKTTPPHMNPTRILGIKEIPATVIFSSETMIFTNCKGQAEHNRIGFYIARLNNTNEFTLYCGTQYKQGQNIVIKIEEGI